MQKRPALCEGCFYLTEHAPEVSCGQVCVALMNARFAGLKRAVDGLGGSHGKDCCGKWRGPCPVSISEIPRDHCAQLPKGRTARRPTLAIAGT